MGLCTYDAPMHITPIPVSTNSTPTPPARWAQWWTSPLARIDYGMTSVATPWHEAFIPAHRTVAGNLAPTLTFAGSNLAVALEAAHALASHTVAVTYDVTGGRQRTIQVHPAIGILRDARAGVYWLAELRTTVRSRGEWVDAPHTIDGGAFTGRAPVLSTPDIRTATNALIAVVGKDTTITPRRWRNAPDDSRIDARDPQGSA